MWISKNKDDARCEVQQIDEHNLPNKSGLSRKAVLRDFLKVRYFSPETVPCPGPASLVALYPGDGAADSGVRWC